MPHCRQIDLDLMPRNLISSGEHECIYQQGPVKEVSGATSEESREMCKMRHLEVTLEYSYVAYTLEGTT
jgi:hypothetical protein